MGRKQKGRTGQDGDRRGSGARPRRKSTEHLDIRGERRSLEGLRAHQLAKEHGLETPGPTGSMSNGVLVQVCLECGKEYTFDTEPPASGMRCEKCGNQVFRSFFAVMEYDEVDEDFRETTERDLATTDDGEDVTRADVLDLNNP